MFVTSFKYFQTIDHVPLAAVARVKFESFLEACGVLQEAHEYTHPVIGRELGKLPSKLVRWAAAFWALSRGVAVVTENHALMEEVGSCIGVRWVRQAETVLGYFTHVKACLRTPALRPAADLPSPSELLTDGVPLVPVNSATSLGLGLGDGGA